MAWRSSASARVALVGALLLALAAALLVAAPGRAARPDAANAARLDRTIRFLQDVQNADGGFGGEVGAPSDPLFSAWVAIALAAGGVNPRDQRLPGGGDVYAYVTQHAGALDKTTDFERAALVAVAAGVSPRDFGGHDLVRAILARQLPSGAFAFDATGGAGFVNATAFAILPLSTLHDPAVDAALRRGADWLLSVQDASGAWGYAPGAELSSDTTAGVLQALHALGRTGTPQERRAWDYVRSLQNDDGGFGFSTPLRESNSASTSWVLQAMWAAGVDPARFAPGKGDPRDYLASMQQRNGAIRWKRSESLNSIWMTAYAAPAYGGRPLPVTPVARAVHVVARAEQTTAVPARRAPQAAADDGLDGQGGFSTRRGEVIAGGGGRGAGLFSRPQPQSQGRRAGGVRRTTPASAARGGAAAGAGSGASAQPAGGGADGGAAGSVTGVVIGDTREPGAAPAAPGLLGAQAGAGRHGPALALAIVGMLLLCAGAGAGLERRRPEAIG